MAFLRRLARTLVALAAAPILLSISAIVLAVADLAWRLFGRAAPEPPVQPNAAAAGGASVVIPNWNGKDLLASYLPSVIQAMAGNPANEIIVVENGSSDGSAEFVRTNFPTVKVLALAENQGFGGGCNAGVRAASNRIAVLLNSDMRVAPDFLAPLVEGFSDPLVFAVSCQIFFTDPNKVREETGLTEGWWQDGGLHVRHRIDPAIAGLFPCFYGGGGSCAFDREKFLELGGFDPLLEPFYLEDTDLGYMAWKRGWKVLYQPRSIVYHEHRGTIGKKYSEERIHNVLRKNYVLFCWKNIHEPGKLASSFLFAFAGSLLSAAFGDTPLRPNLTAVWRAFSQVRQAVRSRWRARALGQVSDTEAFRRPLGGYYHDRFSTMDEAPRRLRVLFVSPYPICPPVHGGAVFMFQTLRQLARLAETHVVEMLDIPAQAADNEDLRSFCASAQWLVRPPNPPKSWGSLKPHAVREIAVDDLAWTIHRELLLKRIDVLQLEYTSMAQYRGDYRRIVNALFEHDVYFQSVARGVGQNPRALNLKARIEYLRALRYELRALPRFDQVQVCTPANRDYLLSYAPGLAPRLKAGLRAGIDADQYEFRGEGREPLTMLFLGSFRHSPNRAALDWFIGRVLPIILKKQPRARLIVAGSDPPPAYTYTDSASNIEMLGHVDDVREPLGRYAAFVCPILSGSGVRVKLLEAFAAGIPVVSTKIGAEGLARKDGEFCLLADEPEAFAERALTLLEQPETGYALARRARREVEAHWHMEEITRRLLEGYGELVREKRGA
jgi:O-antigen biosynthesis protein